MMQGHAVAGGEAFYMRACANHGPCDFVPEYAGRVCQTVLDFLEVRAAHSTGVHSHQQFSLLDLRHGDLFKCDLVLSAVDGCAHSCFHGGGAGFSFERRGLHSSDCVGPQVRNCTLVSVAGVH